MKTITATELRTRFLQILETSEHGASYLVTRYGHPVAKMLPPADFKPDAKLQKELQGVFDRYGGALDELA